MRIDSLAPEVEKAKSLAEKLAVGVREEVSHRHSKL